MVTRFVHEPEDIRRENRARAAAQRKNLDWQGIALMTVGLASLQYVLEEGSSNDWFASHTIAIMSFVAVFVLAAFVIRELTAPVPAVDLSLFKDRVFLSGTLIGAVMFAILMSITFLLPLFMQELLGFPALASGQALMPRALAMMVGIPLVGRLYNRVQPRILVIIGVLLVALSAYLMSHYTLATSARSVVAAIVDPGVRLRRDLRAADDGRAGRDPALPPDRRDRAELAAAADRRVAGPGRVRDAAAPLRRRPRAPAWPRTPIRDGPR